MRVKRFRVGWFQLTPNELRTKTITPIESLPASGWWSDPNDQNTKYVQWSDGRWQSVYNIDGQLIEVSKPISHCPYRTQYKLVSTPPGVIYRWIKSSGAEIYQCPNGYRICNIR